MSLPAGCWLHQHWPQPSAVIHPLQSRPQVTRISRHKSSCSNSRGHATQHSKSRKHGTQSRKSSSAPVKPAQSAKPQDTLTAPMQVKVLAQLSKLEQAANPWWSTFCGVTNGLWLGQTAAFAPSTGTAVVRCTPFLSWQRHCNVHTDTAAWCCKCYLLQLYAGLAYAFHAVTVTVCLLAFTSHVSLRLVSDTAVIATEASISACTMWLQRKHSWMPRSTAVCLQVFAPFLQVNQRLWPSQMKASPFLICSHNVLRTESVRALRTMSSGKPYCYLLNCIVQDTVSHRTPVV